MRKSIIPLLLAFCSLAYGQNTIVIKQKDGQVARFSFTEKPVVTYMGDEAILTTTKTTVQYPIYLLQKITFDIDWNSTDIKEMVIDKPTFCFQGDAIIISGDVPGTLVRLYSVGGSLVGQYRSDTQGRVTIPLHQLDKGIYIVKSRSIAFKFRKP